MNKKIAFIAVGAILLLIARSRPAYAADASAELFDAVKSGNVTKVEQLLAAGADPNARGGVGLTPLISAAMDGRAEIGKLLLNNGADINAKSDSGMTALMLAAALGQKEMAQLLLDNGADAGIRDRSGLTAYQIASARRHEETAALLKPGSVGTPDAISSFFAMKQRFIITVLYPCLFVVMSAFFLVIGLRGVMTKKPFLISARWLLVLVVLGLTPSMLNALTFPGSGADTGTLALHWLVPGVLVIVLIFLSFAMRGYIAFGVTDTSFREGLLASLKGLNLEHEETLSVLRLPAMGADLQVAVQSWMGTAQIKMRQRKFHAVLHDIVRAMNDYYRNAEIPKINLTSCIFYVIVGVFLLVFAGVFMFGLSKIV
jgi:uncharacterized protein